MDCFKDAKDWMAFNFLNLKEDKTEVIVFGPSLTYDIPPPLDLGPLQPLVRPIVTNLGIMILNLTNRHTM